MEQWFAFRAYNSQEILAFGTEGEANRYADHLNRNREINVYGAYPLTDEEVTEKNLESCGDTFNLEDALSEIDA